MPNFDKARAGDPLRIPAATYNELLAMLAWYRGQGRGLGSQSGFTRDPDVVPLKNGSGADIADPFNVLGIDSPLFTPSDNLTEFKFNFALKGVTPDDVTHYSQVAILQAPVVDNGVVPAVLSGLSIVKLDVGHASHTHADVKDNDKTKLKTEFSGSARILWKESGTGDKWGIVRLGEGPQTVLGKTDAAIAKGASGTVSIWTPDATSDTGANVTSVANRFADVAITKWVFVTWLGKYPHLSAKEC